MTLESIDARSYLIVTTVTIIDDIHRKKNEPSLSSSAMNIVAHSRDLSVLIRDEHVHGIVHLINSDHHPHPR